MKKIISLLIGGLFTTSAIAQPNTDRIGNLTVHAMHHASMAMSLPGKLLFVDPVDHLPEFEQIGSPDIILLTDIHGDHFSVKTLDSLLAEKTTLVVPQAVAEKLPESFRPKVVVLHNGEEKTVKGTAITAIPMYNLPESADAYHTKGRGNGYVLLLDGKRIYISGDTEGIPEMRGLKNIDVAFVCMNLPYTMDIHQAADAVLDFKPKIIYPYHYGKSDVKAFKKMVESKNNAIDVRLLAWYL